MSLGRVGWVGGRGGLDGVEVMECTVDLVAPVIVVTLIWVGVSPGGGLTGVMMGLAILVLGFDSGSGGW